MAKKPKTPEIALPVSLLFDNPALQWLSGSEHRAVIMICLAYWRAGCPPRQLSESSYAMLAKMQRGEWNHVRTSVLPAIRIMLPILEATFNHRQTMRAHLAQAQAAGAAATKRRRLLERQQRAVDAPVKLLQDTPAPARQHATPRKAPAHEEPRAPMTPKTLAAIPNPATVPKTERTNLARLTDE